ncbi:MAG: TatD family nuclease-associated radical SAM protein [Elusimicrobia bacterium]|nr:TatD family nuclease-associated radical SAM protein [Elusimicrobiota bacterium]
MNTFAYKYKTNIYLNITNRCMMACPYCIKHKWVGAFRGNDLALTHEPSVTEVINAIKNIGDLKDYKEIIFCGYGDALIRLEETIEIAKQIKGLTNSNANGIKIRINTAGLANKYYGRNILPDLKGLEAPQGHDARHGLIDSISISLNGSNQKDFADLNRPMFSEEAFDEIINFAKEAKLYIPEVTITAVALPALDVKAVEDIAKSVGVNFRLRPYLDAYEDH